MSLSIPWQCVCDGCKQYDDTTILCRRNQCLFGGEWRVLVRTVPYVCMCLAVCVWVGCDALGDCGRERDSAHQLNSTNYEELFFFRF